MVRPTNRPPRARMGRWPDPVLVILIVLWVVPGAVFASPFGSALLLAASLTLLIFVWLALPIPILIDGLIWIRRVRRPPSTRSRWALSRTALPPRLAQLSPGRRSAFPTRRQLPATPAGWRDQSLHCEGLITRLKRPLAGADQDPPIRRHEMNANAPQAIG